MRVEWTQPLDLGGGWAITMILRLMEEVQWYLYESVRREVASGRFTNIGVSALRLEWCADYSQGLVWFSLSLLLAVGFATTHNARLNPLIDNYWCYIRSTMRHQYSFAARIDIASCAIYFQPL
jgi:hypothetical protein